MAVAFAVFPDAEALTGAWLRAGTGWRAYSAIPSSPTWPLIRYRRIGGIPLDRRWVDRAALQFDVYADKLQSQAQDLAAAVRQRLMLMEGELFTTAGGDPADAEIKAVRDNLGMFYSPDPSYTPARPRYIFGVELTLHPLIPSEV